MSADPFTSLNSDTTELILSYLPIPSLLRASSVCKRWHSLITTPTFPVSLHHHNRPWFFLHGLHNTSSKNNQSFAFDPSSNSWFLLPSSPFPSPDVTGSNGFLFCTAPCFSFSAVLKPRWKSTSPFRFSRINPLLGVFCDDDCQKTTSSSTSMPKFIVVGGVRFIGGLVDIEDRLAVEIYDPATDSWDLCPPLPVDFRSGYSSQTLSAALFKDRFFVFGIYTFFVSSFDLEKRVWSQVQTLRPPGVVFAFLIACQEMFVLAGVCSGPHGPSFNLWGIDEKNMEFSEIAIMPQDLLYGLVDGEEDDGNKFASLKCVGMGSLIYVFNEEYHKRYPACVCEISTSDSGKCSWRRVPKLPSPVNKFHRVISFCSTVLPHHVFGGEEEEIGMVVAGY